MLAALGVASAAWGAETAVESAPSLEAPSLAAHAPDAPAIRALIGDGVLVEGAPVVRLGAPEDFVGVDMYPTGGDPLTCMTRPSITRPAPRARRVRRLSPRWS